MNIKCRIRESYGFKESNKRGTDFCEEKVTEKAVNGRKCKGACLPKWQKNRLVCILYLHIWIFFCTFAPAFCVLAQKMVHSK